MKTLLVLLAILGASIQCSKSIPSEIRPATISVPQLWPVQIPVIVGKTDQLLYSIKFKSDPGKEKILLKNIVINFTKTSQSEGIASLSATIAGTENQLIGTSTNITKRTILKGEGANITGATSINLLFTLKTDVLLSAHFEIENVELAFSDNRVFKITPELKFVYRPGLLLRAAGQDKVDTYRIPGLATTNQGTLIGVYDLRYNTGIDLQEDIDVGMSRSTNGGQTWESLRKIADMGEWGGLPQNQNGIGDPCVLVDKATNIIWVAALWGHGKPGERVWNSSRSGLTPDETGQFVLVKSEDDGLTWSEPINITTQVKRPEWNLFFQGPGKGITMNDGTLVFPAQYKDENQVPWSTLIYSKDHGKTWRAGKGAKSNTTEAQVVELSDGILMLNMRDNRNRTDKGSTNGRAVAITSDLGQTWTTHPSSNSALPEPNCMASLISVNANINGQIRQVLIFSNPNSKNSRSNMTVKASLDSGLTWPEDCQIELNSAEGFGYSCLTMVDENTIGIIYEGEKELYFQKIALFELLKDHSK